MSSASPIISKQQSQDFSQSVLHWYQHNGRKTLPWQQPATAYRVWISEIMLQQNQVDTVVPYFEKFMQHFPNLQSLADSNNDKVMHLWSGLGYYARARNLHKTSIILSTQQGGELPSDLEQLQALPGIGRSTAGAILSLGFHQPAAILDGNVKRVLARHFCIPGWPSKVRVLKNFWAVSEQLTPENHSGQYNQAMMDIGATLCKRSKPSCEICPLSNSCKALKTDQISVYPEKKPSKIKPVREQHFLLIKNQQGEILLNQRPPAGIWGSLWCLPESFQFQPENIAKRSLKPATQFTHQFTHFTLKATVTEVSLINTHQIMDAANWSWYDPDNPAEVGLPAPMISILHNYFQLAIRN